MFVFQRSCSKQAGLVGIVNKSSGIDPFAKQNPFEPDSSARAVSQSLNQTPIYGHHYHQNDLFRFDTMRHHFHYGDPQAYSWSMNTPMTNSSSFAYHKLNPNLPASGLFKVNDDRVPTTCLSPSSPSCNCCHYSPTTELTLPSSLSFLSSHMRKTSSRRAKVNITKKH